MSNQWYILHVISSKEKQIRDDINKMVEKEKLKNQVPEIFMATEEIIEIRNGVKKRRKKKNFPGYLFINIDLKKDGKVDKELLNKIKYCNNVIGFLGGENPKAISEDEINAMKEKAKNLRDESTHKPDFSIGEMIRIKQGPFESHQGEITAINSEKGKIQVMVTIFDRQTILDNIEYWQIEKIS